VTAENWNNFFIFFSLAWKAKYIPHIGSFLSKSNIHRNSFKNSNETLLKPQMKLSNLRGPEGQQIQMAFYYSA
jgi:hypothetical protein